ncbi:Uncharacterized HTH-type transcriptional regulator YhjC [Pseudomonas knackmussii B13]|uniref:Uncharacterized HTH-type transcriptional regulator YhjC n=1 Tax=Pseudomonas knackmussii (strain DSM 6978 / CCUG 54928 / LMG 23759 / B13) TaxID=1301098 RepID=A0A024HH10_PSEKB|nr:LysR family transcriptional regulator [Pseudomonas knackmussii]CDF84325.1 Uncharacterized HTH-type transcriptional regulator YhjC [Pseudomonas knackmussii B13]
MIKPELLRTFIRVTELSSFTQAGEQLGLPRSTVSEQVQALEELLGTRLLQRTTRRVHATQDGLVFYERSKELLAQMDELQGLFRQDGAVLAGRLRVDLPTILARKVVMPRLGEFTARYPGIELEVSSTDRRVDLVREGFDCVLRIGGGLDASLVARRLGGFAQINLASPAYLREFGTPHSLDDLAGHRLVHYVPVLGMRPMGFEYEQDGQTRYQPMAGSVTVNNAEAYEGACLGGLGIIQAPRHGALDYLAEGRLVEVLPEYRPAPLDIHLLYAHRRPPPRVQAFMQWLQERVEEAARV